MKNVVSVIIPSYGGGQYLKRAVDSVLQQTYPHIEVIVVDDNGMGTANQTATEQVMNEYVGDNRVRYICHEVNKNGSAARNTGVKESKGAYIALLDDDDIYLPDNIKTQIETLSQLSDEYALTYCSNETYRGDKKLWEDHVSYSGDILYDVLLHRATIGSTSLLIRKSVWEELGGFDESFRRHQDWEFTARVCSKYKVKAVDKIGFRRYLEFRNSPKSVELAKEYRIHYLEKMKPYMTVLRPKQIKKVIVYNRLDVSIQYLKKKEWGKFWNDVKSIKPGALFISFFCRRLAVHMKKM